MVRVLGDPRIGFFRVVGSDRIWLSRSFVAASMLTFCVLLLLGCGKGPKHLSSNDYGHGKTAFEALERANMYDLFSSDSQLAEDEIKEISNEELRDALNNYVMARLVTTNWSLTAALDGKKILLAKPGPERSALGPARRRAEMANSEAERVLVLCHDDAAAFFDEKAAATYTCSARLAKFEKDYPSGKD
jgi:hypothetical protein